MWNTIRVTKITQSQNGEFRDGFRMVCLDIVRFSLPVVPVMSANAPSTEPEGGVTSAGAGACSLVRSEAAAIVLKDAWWTGANWRIWCLERRENPGRKLLAWTSQCVSVLRSATTRQIHASMTFASHNASTNRIKTQWISNDINFGQFKMQALE